MNQEEFAENLKSRTWRLNNLYYIVNKDGEKVRFKLNWAQEKLLEELHFKNLILKARQLGMTTFICILFLDTCLFNSNISAGVIAHGREEATAIFRNKIKFAYDNLPPEIRATRPASTDRAGELLFNNNSSIRVATSFRSGTLQYLLISEFGKICAKYPDKAKEIVTGAIQAVKTGNAIFIESTAEGQQGYFYEYCDKARTKLRLEEELTAEDYKFHFYPWYENPEYTLDAKNVDISQESNQYFNDIERELGIKLNKEQRAWYVKKEEELQGDMKREYPSTPDEAFEQTIEGAYYEDQFRKIETRKQIIHLPYEPALPLFTAWDLGLDDYTAIWFIQPEGERFRIIDYYENNGEDLDFYVNILREKEYHYHGHYLPHDVEVRDLVTNKTRKSKLEALGLKNILVAKSYPGALDDGINEVRSILPKCWFDKNNTKQGRSRLKQYRKAWDEKQAMFKSTPLHDMNSHGADAFRTFAMAWIPTSPRPTQTQAINKYRKNTRR